MTAKWEPYQHKPKTANEIQAAIDDAEMLEDQCQCEWCAYARTTRLAAQRAAAGVNL